MIGRCFLATEYDVEVREAEFIEYFRYFCLEDLGEVAAHWVINRVQRCQKPLVRDKYCEGGLTHFGAQGLS